MLGFWSVVIVQRNRDYSNEIKLFAHTSIQSPDTPLIHNNLGSVYMSRGLVEEAAREFERSLALKPDQSMVWSNLGTVYKQTGQYEKAIPFLKKLTRLRSNDMKPVETLAVAFRAARVMGPAPFSLIPLLAW